MNYKVPFLITIDTEGDNLWDKPMEITTYNAKNLYRFQRLCNEYGFKPTYLTNYEMAMDAGFVDFGKKLSLKGEGEIGMHLHGWNSPPIARVTGNDYLYQPYLIEYPEELMEEKISFLTELLENKFEDTITSHRAGRWAMNEIYMKLLEKYNYTVDCSVTPGISWAKSPGGKQGFRGSDYTRFPREHYHPDYRDISKKGTMKLLEIPMTIIKKPKKDIHLFNIIEKTPLRRSKLISRALLRSIWVRPGKNDIDDILEAVIYLVENNAPYIEFMLHSSELSAGLSPSFPTEESIEKLYIDMERFFKGIAPYVCGKTLKEFYRDNRINL
ncbi:MAG: hypothetical protein ACI33K_11020 [Clostridiaceae bacterium]